MADTYPDLSWNTNTDDEDEKAARRKAVQNRMQWGAEATTSPYYAAKGVEGEPVEPVEPVAEPAQPAKPPSKWEKSRLGQWTGTMGTAIGRGFLQGRQSDEVAKVMLEGQNATPEQVRAMVEAIERTNEHGPSPQLQAFMRESEGGAWDTMKALARYGSTVIPEVFLQSFAGMAAPEVLGQGVATVGGTATAGAIAGAPAGGVGAGPGALAGGRRGSTLRWA